MEYLIYQCETNSFIILQNKTFGKDFLRKKQAQKRFITKKKRGFEKKEKAPPGPWKNPPPH